MLMQNFGVTNKERYGMFWYFLEWSIVFLFPLFQTRALLYPLISCITISCLWIGIRTSKFRNCLKRVLKDATAGVPSSFDKKNSTNPPESPPPPPPETRAQENARETAKHVVLTVLFQNPILKSFLAQLAHGRVLQFKTSHMNS